MAIYYDPIGTFIQTYQADGLAGMSFGNGPATAPTQIRFATGTSQANQDIVNNAAASWDWTVLPTPNPNGFVSAITTDSTLTSILFLLMPYYAAIQNYIIAPAAIKTAWASLKSAYPAQLTSGIVTTVEGYATANNIPLT